MRNLFILFIALSTIIACKSSSKHLAKGDYDAAMQKSAKKIMKDPGDFEEVDVFNDAYRMAYIQDNAEVTRLKKQGNPANWATLFTIYTRMNKRQLLAQSLPTTGINYEEQDFISEIENARLKAAEYAYAKGAELLEKNDKLKAREAYERFLEAKRFAENFKDVDAKIEEARYLGMTNVFFTIEDNADVVAPKQLIEELQIIEVNDLDKDWLNYDNYVDTNLNYHYSIILSMEQILVSPEEVKEDVSIESKEVEDGFTYVFDENGNVKKDSLGNDIKMPKYKTIRCNVKRVHQRKSARISGNLNYYDNMTNKLMKKEPVTSDALFEHFYTLANGDLNALSPKTANELQSEPVPFPPNEALIIQAGDVLKGMTKDIIINNKEYLK
ncbi:MAG: hypothetical protein H6587_07030 [Flavobacteriales bacterium]|nr:hypothetical protein [Flavobacteriales bacterium]MCB9364302.1 hypothetical protein [Flavobacteriales bacterium]